MIVGRPIIFGLGAVEPGKDGVTDLFQPRPSFETIVGFHSRIVEAGSLT
jgi:hypothetical protein